MSNQRIYLLAALLSVGVTTSAKADFTLAVHGPMTGAYAIFGDQMKRAADFSVKLINEKGGVLGQKLAVAIGDDACDPKQAVSIANRAAGQHVAAVIGHFCSGSSIPALDVYHEANILQITPASTNPKLTDDAAAKKWGNIFRTCGRDDNQGVVAGNWLAKTYQGKRIAVLHDKSPYGKGLADATKENMNKGGVKEVLFEAYNPGEKDYNALISKLKAEKIDLVYIGGYHTEVGLMLRQAREAGFNAQFVSGDANATDELGLIAGPAAEGFLFTFGPDPRKNPAAKETVDALRASGFEPEGYTLYTVAAFQVWAEAAKQANSVDTAKIAAAIHGHSFETVVGRLTYDQKGDVIGPQYVLYVWKNGKYVEANLP